MKKNKLNILIILLSLFLLFMFIFKKIIIRDTIIYSLNIWVNSLIPSLFPFFIISDILINYNIINYIPNFLKNFCKYIFNITDNMLVVLFLSMISGFPSNARNIRYLYDKNLIDLEEANHILMFSHFANPVFILSTISIFFFNDKDIGIVILGIHYLSNFILGIMMRGAFVHNSSKVYSADNNYSFGNVLINAIKRAIDTVLLICGIVCVFLVLSVLILDIFNVNSYLSIFVKGFFEITIGVEALGMLIQDYNYRLVISSAILAFGGLSVHMQVYSQIGDTDINYKYFLYGRIYQMVIAILLCFIFIK